MHNQLAVRVADRVANRQERMQSRGQVHCPCVGAFIEWRAFHVLGDQIRQAIVGDAAIEQLRNARVMEPCENLPFHPKAAQRAGRNRRMPDQL